MSPILKRLLPIAFVAVAFVAVHHAPANADSAPTEQVCGSVDLSASNNGDAAKAFDCFSAAFARCNPATLVASGQDAAIATTWTFTTVDSEHGCSVAETIERGTGNNKTTDAFLCRGVSRDKDGLHITGCGGSKDVSLRLSSTLGAAPQPVAVQTNPKKI